jgi:NAD(P)-dependent dehydrogenase (short-subunit alcohol dehydrogenase family)
MGGLAEGKVVLVTGAASGIGRAAALLFHREGARAVVVADIDAESVDETAELVRAAGGVGLALEVDIANAAAVDAMVARTVGEFGRLDCAFNNAGVAGKPARTADCTEENWDFVIATMLTGTWLCMRRELRQMLEQRGGAIVNTASVASFVASPALPAYTAAKHGIAGLTKTAALEYVLDNIRVNAICPGATLSRMMLDNAGSSPDALERIAQSQPGQRISDPLEQAQAAVWLCSDRASFVNGTLLTVDNAATAGGTYTHEGRADAETAALEAARAKGNDR